MRRIHFKFSHTVENDQVLLTHPKRLGLLWLVTELKRLMAEVDVVYTSDPG